MAISATLAEKIADAKTSKKGNHLTEGNFLCVTKRIICDDNNSGTCFIPEFDVVKAEQTNPAVIPNKEGSEASFVWPINAGGAYGNACKANINGFVSAVLDIDPADKTKLTAEMSKHCGPKNDPDQLRARGRLFLAQSYKAKIQSGERKDTYGVFFNFMPVAQTDIEVAQRRAELDAAKR